MAVLARRDVRVANGAGELATDFVWLRDGRRLAYSELGDPDGIPIIHQHGMPGSRLEHEAEPEFYRSLGVRVITPDRPGYGLSDFNPARRLLDWPSDVAELADSLGMPRFGITGLSGGGIYALACAAVIPHRLTEVVVTGCPGPMDRKGAMTDMRFMTRAGVWLGSRAPGCSRRARRFSAGWSGATRVSLSIISMMACLMPTGNGSPCHRLMGEQPKLS